MKVKYLSFLLFIVFFGVLAEDCEYLRDPKQSFVTNDCKEYFKNQQQSSFIKEEKPEPGTTFNCEYPYELCKLNAPIHKESIEYIQGIRDKEGQDIQEVVTEIGNVFCRGYLGECGDASFYTRFVQSCEEAREKTAEKLKEQKKMETISADFIAYSYNSCDELSETYAMAYKETAMEEAAHYHKKIIEESAEEYLTPSQEKMLNLGIVWDSFIKIFGNIARSLEGWTQTVFAA